MKTNRILIAVLGTGVAAVVTLAGFSIGMENNTPAVVPELEATVEMSDPEVLVIPGKQFPNEDAQAELAEAAGPEAELEPTMTATLTPQN